MTDKRHCNKGRPCGSGHNGVKHYLTADEVSAFMREARRTGRKDDLAFALAFHYALRVGELAGIRLTDFRKRDVADGQGMQMCLTIRPLKGGATVEPPVPPFIAVRLKAWLKERGKDASPFLFPSTITSTGHVTPGSFQAAFRTILKRAGITTRHSIHDLRHTAAHILALNGKTLPEVAGWLRHKDPASASDYVGTVAMDRQAADVAVLTEELLR